MPENAGPQRREVYYRGIVQGVGFRYAVWSIAFDFAVTGFVQNLPDGRVKLVAEGEPAELDRFLAAILRQRGPDLDDIQQTAGPATGEFRRFEIRH